MNYLLKNRNGFIQVFVELANRRIPSVSVINCGYVKLHPRTFYVIEFPRSFVTLYLCGSNLFLFVLSLETIDRHIFESDNLKGVLVLLLYLPISIKV